MRLVQTAGAAVVMTAASLFSYAEEPFDAESLRRSQGELLLQIEQLRQETQALRGLMEELSYQLGQMSSDQKTRYLDLDQRLGELVRIQKEAVATSSTLTSTPATADSTTGGVGEAGAQASVSNDISDQDAYNSAFQLIRERKFEEALVAMDSFIRAYPDSELVLDARFWRGQVFDVLGRDEEAIEAFKSLTLVAPDYRRILQVKVKLGKLLIKNQDVMNGRKILQEVITQAPESVEAGLASRELEKTN
ncbi:MAG: YbgF trimerization domain-containing protein [Gammaproteobacteria bacterium]